MNNLAEKPLATSRKLNKSTKIHIRPVTEQIVLENHALCAINWFNLKRNWMYDLYNQCVASRLAKVGGQLLFKGDFVQQIEGKDTDARDMLLIVQYPSVNAFLDLVSNTFFQIASVLRNASVKDFNIGFTQRLSRSQIPTENFADKVYLVHYFRSTQIPRELSKKLEAIEKSCNVSLYYAGNTVARIEIEKKGKAVPMPFLMDGIIIFEYTKEKGIRTLLDDAVYKQIREELKDNYLAVFRRIA